MRNVVYNLVGEDRRATLLLPFLAFRASVGYEVEVGPFDDDACSRIYCWVRGPEDEVDTVLSKVEKMAKDRGIKFVKTPLIRERAKG
jgi:hypothetical protein